MENSDKKYYRVSVLFKMYILLLGIVSMLDLNMALVNFKSNSNQNSLNSNQTSLFTDNTSSFNDSINLGSEANRVQVPKRQPCLGEQGSYPNNNVTEVDFLLERSESTKREDFYPYHYQHVDHPGEVYLGHHGGQINFPHHDYGHHQHHDYHGHHHVRPHHDLGYDVAVKAALGPLVGVALLGVVAALVANPVLLQLGVVSGKRRRRRRRHTHPAAALELSMITSLLSQVPKSSYLLSQEKSMVENYMKCSGLLNSIQDGCLLRLACELWNENSTIFQAQRNVVRRTLSEIMSSEIIPDRIRFMIHQASKHGEQMGHCKQYRCNHLELSRDDDIEKYIKQ